MKAMSLWISGRASAMANPVPTRQMAKAADTPCETLARLVMTKYYAPCSTPGVKSRPSTVPNTTQTA